MQLYYYKKERLRWDSNPQPPNNHFITTRSPTRYPLRHGAACIWPKLCPKLTFYFLFVENIDNSPPGTGTPDTHKSVDEYFHEYANAIYLSFLTFIVVVWNFRVKVLDNMRWYGVIYPIPEVSRDKQVNAEQTRGVLHTI